MLVAQQTAARNAFISLARLASSSTEIQSYSLIPTNNICGPVTQSVSFPAVIRTTTRGQTVAERSAYTMLLLTVFSEPPRYPTKHFRQSVASNTDPWKCRTAPAATLDATNRHSVNHLETETQFQQRLGLGIRPRVIDYPVTTASLQV